VTGIASAAILGGVLIGAVCAVSPESGGARVVMAAIVGPAWWAIVGMVFP
jgi:hypothetical protein